MCGMRLYLVFMIQRPPRSTRSDTRFPYTTLFRSLYVHWPFCLSKCPYCDFNSHVRDSIDQPRWRKALLAELDHNRSEEHTSELQSLMRISYAVFCLTNKIQSKNYRYTTHQNSKKHKKEMSRFMT